MGGVASGAVLRSVPLLLGISPSEPELMGRIALAALLGAVIGLERELSEKPAGLRTHALVALGAAAFTVAGYAALDLPDATTFHPDVARIAAQVVTGIGFLGAGIIIFHGDRLRGLTTAAELWVVAALGVLCGLGFMTVATVTTGIVLVVVVGGRPLEKVLDRIRIRHLRRTDLAEALEEEAEAKRIHAEEGGLTTDGVEHGREGGADKAGGVLGGHPVTGPRRSPQ
ncbi:MAG: hypothetical protein NVSMB29_19830 [Candidatus Dormibacteria bacterium]